MKNIQSKIEAIANKYFEVKIISKEEALRIGNYALEQNPDIARYRDIYVNIQVDTYYSDTYKYEICEEDEKPNFIFYAKFKVYHHVDKKILKLQYTHRSIEGDPEYFIDTIEPFKQIWKNAFDAIYFTVRKTTGKLNPDYKSGIDNYDWTTLKNQKYINYDEIHATTDETMKELGYLRFSNENFEITTIPISTGMLRFHVSIGFHDCGHDDTGDVCSNIGGFDFFFDRHI